MRARRTTPALVAWGLFGVTIAMLVLTEGLKVLNSAFDVGYLALELLFGVPVLLLGPIIASRRPDNRIGWLFVVSMVLIEFGGSGNFGPQFITYSVVHSPQLLPGTVAVAWLTPLAITLGFFPLVLFVMLLFPTGRLPSPRWRPLAWIAAAYLTWAAVQLAFAPGWRQVAPGILFENPLGIGFIGATSSGPGPIVPIALAAACFLSVFTRFPSARGDEREQLKWFAFGSAFMVVVAAVAMTLPNIPGFKGVAALLFPVSVTGQGVAIGIALLRYRLYEIDVVINRTLVYGATSATLAAAFAGTQLVLQTALRPLTTGNDLAVAGSTLLIAGLFVPVRRRIREVVDRRFYRSKYDAARTIDAFSARLRDEIDLDTLRRELESAVQSTMRPRAVHVWLRSKARPADRLP